MVIQRFEQSPLLLDNLKDPVIVTDDTTEIYRNNSLGFLRDRSFQLLIIHLRHVSDKIAIFLYIHEYNLCPAVNGCRGRSGIGVSRNDNFVVWTYSQYSKIEFFSSSCRS